MKQNSLFFDRGQGRGVQRGASLLVTIAFLAFVGFIIIRYKYFTYILREQLMTTPKFGILVLAYCLLAIVFFTLIRRFNCRGCHSPWAWGAVIFFLALGARLIAYQYIVYVPTSDFANYYDMGVAFVRGDYAFIANTAAGYHISSFSGLGVINGLIMMLSGTDVRSFQLAQCVITSLIAAVVYLLARRVDEASAPAAGLLFAFYPANIVFSQVTSNQHIAILFALLSIWMAILAFSQPGFLKAAGLALGSAVLLLLSYFSHPSTATTLIAFGILWLVVFFSALKKKQELLRLLLVCVVFCVGFFALRAGAEVGMRAAGLSGESSASSNYLAKVVIGLNPDTVGGYSAEDWGSIWAQPEEEQNAFCIEVIRERLKQDDLFGFFDAKILRMWMVPDVSFGWAMAGETPTGQANAMLVERDNWLAGAKLLDFFYVAFLFVLAWVGGLLRRRGSAADLLLWVMLGWMGAHLLIEIQTRYRYFAMPLLMIFAAYGCFCLFGGAGDLLHARIQKRKQATTQEKTNPENNT